LVAIAYAPCSLDVRVAGKPLHVEVKTDYPFADTIQVRVEAAEPVRFPLYLRVPNWAEDARLELGGKVWPDQVWPGLSLRSPGQSATARDKSAGASKTQPRPHNLFRIDRTWQGRAEATLHLPMPLRIRRGYHDSVSLERGPLVFALPIGADWKRLKGNSPFADWVVYPTTPW